MDVKSEVPVLLLLSIVLAVFQAHNRFFFATFNAKLIRRRRQRRIRALMLYASVVENRCTDRCRFQNPRRAWIWPRLQYLFEDLLAGNLPDEKRREHFRVSRETFFKICDVVGPELSRKDTVMRQAIMSEKRVAIAFFRLASGNSF